MVGQDALRALVRADAPIDDALRGLGISVHRDESGLSMNVPTEVSAEVDLADLAVGLLREWTLGSTLREWAAVVLMLAVDFEGVESDDGQALLEALWAASANEPLSDNALAVAQRLVQTP